MADDAGTGADNTSGPEGDGVDAGEITPPAANDWWKFETKEAAAEWGNKLVQDRLGRFKKSNLNPIEQERDTLKAEIEKMKPVFEASLTDNDRREAREEALKQELEELRTFRTRTERTSQINGIADEVGLDKKFLKFVTVGDDADEDAIRTNIKDLLDVLSEGGSNTKQPPKQKAPKETDAPKGKQLQSGGGADSDDTDDALSNDIIAEIRNRRKNGGLTLHR